MTTATNLRPETVTNPRTVEPAGTTMSVAP